MRQMITIQQKRTLGPGDKQPCASPFPKEPLQLADGHLLFVVFLCDILALFYETIP